MKLNIMKISGFLLSLKSVIFINFFVRYKKILNKDLKIIFFYFPVKSYQDNIIELIDELKKEKNIEVILGYNLGSSDQVKKLDKTFFLNLGYLKYIKKIDIFLSSYVVYEFPESINKIYINHDIYDTPMVNPQDEKNLMVTLSKCNYIFLSSESSIFSFKRKINEFLKNENISINTSLINTGYLKLDHVHQKLKNSEISEDSILLAPTLSSMLTEYNLYDYLDNIIKEILNKSELKLIYRPHPGDLRNIKTNSYIMSINEKFKGNKNFYLDINTSYLDSYKKSKILITDVSGTAYTYAFSKLRPVIFFSKNEKELLKGNFNDLFFFKDRTEVGKVVENVKELNNEINFLIGNIDLYKKKIGLLRSARIKFFNNSLNQNILQLKKILNNKILN